MAETAVMLGQANAHRMLCIGSQVDALTGQEWDLFECPTCGHQERVQWKPYKSQVLKYGEGMITPEDAAAFSVLAKTPAGRAEVNRRLSSAPAHVYLRAPSFEDLRDMAEKRGDLADFERRVDDAIVAGEPLLSFNLGSQQACVYPPGVRGKT